MECDSLLMKWEKLLMKSVIGVYVGFKRSQKLVGTRIAHCIDIHHIKNEVYVT